MPHFYLDQLFMTTKIKRLIYESNVDKDHIPFLPEQNAAWREFQPIRTLVSHQS